MWWFFQWVATLFFAYFYSQIRWCIYYVCWHFARIKCRFSYVKKQVGKKKMSIGSSSSAKTILIFLGEYFFEPSPIRFPCHLWRWNEIDGVDLTDEIVIVLPKALKNSTFGSNIGIFCRKCKKRHTIYIGMPSIQLEKRYYLPMKLNFNT